MTDMVIVKHRGDRAADRFDAVALTGATAGLWACFLVICATLADFWTKMLWMIIPIAVLAGMWTVLSVRAWIHWGRTEPDVVARLHHQHVEMGAPIAFTRGRQTTFARALPVNVGVTRRKEGLRRSTRWLVSNEEASLTFITKGIAPLEEEAAVLAAVASMGLSVDAVYSDGSSLQAG